MKYAISAVVAVVLALVVLNVGSGKAAPAEAQQVPAALNAANGEEVGAVDLSWDAFPGVTSYTVGWLAVEDFEANRANNEWLKHFAYSNVGDVREWTVRRLTPEIDYWLIACESLNDVEPGAVPRCTGWERLTLQADTTACPVQETPAPEPISGDYDADNDGLIEVDNIDRLDAIRYDLDGDGTAADDGASAYAAAFPGAADGMGCPSGGCSGYELADDLDFGTAVSAQGWLPIGSEGAPFTATFDGNGHTIANLFISRGNTNFVGLFGVASADSNIKLIGLTSANVLGRIGVGGLVGLNRGAISDSYVTGGVTGLQGVGGLVGSNDGAITGSYAAAGVAGSGERVGGLVGRQSGGTITGSYSTGSVSGGNDTGGLVGLNDGGITVSYAAGNVSGGNNDTGGLAGENHGTVIASYAIGSVSGGHSPGGLVGGNHGTITGSYATGLVSARGASPGGLISGGSGVVSDSYWDTETSGLSVSRGGEGKTTAELQSPTGNTGIYAAWNSNWWDFGTSEQYPVLKVDGLSVDAQRQ